MRLFLQLVLISTPVIYGAIVPGYSNKIEALDLKLSDGYIQGEEKELMSSTFNCPWPFGSFSDPADCSKYYLCVLGKATRKKCSPFTNFDKRLGRCVSVLIAVCDDTEDQREKTTDNPTISFYQHSTEVSTLKDGTFSCPSIAGTFLHSTDCRMYYVCTSFIPSLKTCSDGKLFDGIKKKCEPAEHVHCGLRLKPDVQSSRPTHPSSRHTHPSSRHTHPSSRHAHPSSRHTHPSSRHTHPSSRHTHPSSRHTHPSSRHTHSSSRPTPPSSRHTHPSSRHTHPSSRHTHPSSRHTHPSSRPTPPSSRHTHKSSRHTHPSSRHTHPSSRHTHPSSGHTHPSSRPTPPSSRHTHPSSRHTHRSSRPTPPSSRHTHPSSRHTHPSSRTTFPSSHYTISRNIDFSDVTSPTIEPSNIINTLSPTYQPTGLSSEHVSPNSFPTNTHAEADPTTKYTHVTPMNTIKISHKPKTASPEMKTKATAPPETTCDADDLDCLIDGEGEPDGWFTCPDNIGAYPHPTSRKLFIFCKNWVPTVKKCGQDLVFSEKLHTCVSPFTYQF